MTPFYISRATLVVYQPHLEKVNVCDSDADVALLLPLLLLTFKFKSEDLQLQATGKSSVGQLHTGSTLHQGISK